MLYDTLPIVIVDIRFDGGPARFRHKLQIGLRRWYKHLPRAESCFYMGLSYTWEGNVRYVTRIKAKIKNFLFSKLFVELRNTRLQFRNV